MIVIISYNYDELKMNSIFSTLYVLKILYNSNLYYDSIKLKFFLDDKN